MSSMTLPLPGVRFHPTDVELINYLKRFLKGESLQCPMKLTEIYGDQPPWKIFGASEEKIGYFISPLKKRKESDERDNNIPRQDDFVVCRIKKNIKQMKDVIAVNYNMDEHLVVDIIQDMLLGPDAYCTIQVPAKDQVMEETDQWGSIIDRVCNDEQADKVENTTTLMHGEYDLRGCNQMINDQTWSSTTLKEEAYGQIEQVQSHGADGIGSNDFWETMNEILGDISIDIPDDLWLVDHQSPLLLITNENV
ncbi:hypothetical protein HAX54_019509 [Datura stramonium]|uniref:NAC domain-containing protein n=1 Tax=Datura stramonium TaxID=4076 RepID=A0ABS8S2B8_DATST|nr:hypothetical protein [Datura stramonium]